MKILHLAAFLQGSAGRVVVDLARAQHEAGHDVAVVVSGRGAPGHGNTQALVDELAAAGVTARLVDSMFERTHAPNLAVVAALNEVYRVGQEPDVIHTHGAIPSLVALLFVGARRARLALLQTMHGWGTVRTPDQVMTDVTVLNLVDRVAVPSAHTASTLASFGVSPSRIVLVPYGVRSEMMEPDDRDQDVLYEMARARRQGRFVLACIATTETRRSQTLLIEAMARLEDMPVLAVFMGDEDDASLREAVARHGCADRVRLHGVTAAARRLSAAADLLVLPSRGEGQFIPTLEAFCDGTLVAVGDMPEMRELVEDGVTGFTFRAGDASALAETIAGAASLPNSTRRAIRERARARYTARHTVSAMAEQYFLLYSSLVNAPRADRQRRNNSPAA